MDIQQRQLINKYLDLFFRRKVIIVTLLLLSLPVGLGLYLRTPKVYQATCLLSYQQQKINPNRMSPDVKSRVRDIVSTLSQIVTSRTNLEKIILDFDLYPQARARIPIEDVVEILRKKIKIKPSSRGDIFTITYSGGRPDKVAKVTNAIAAKFIEENLKYRQEKATDTSAYTNQELQMAKGVMDKQENAMRDYKLKHYNEMPDQRQTNMSQLTALRVQHQGKQESIQDLERTLILIQDQMSNRRTLVQNSAVAVPSAVETGEGQRLRELRSTLEILAHKYTDKHPEIKRLKKLIAKLEKDLEATGGTTGRATTSQSKNRNQQAGVYDQVLMQLEVQRKDIRLSIAKLTKEKELLQKRIDQYEEWVTAAPIREAEWSSLTREYDQLKKHYDYLVAQNLQAESMLNLEVRQKGSQFKIEDPGRVPIKPIEPNFMLIIGMSALVGLGLGGGGSVALDLFDGSIRDPEVLEPLLGVPLLITIPDIETNSEINKKRWRLVLTVVLLTLLSGIVLATFGFAWVRGYIVL